MPIPSRQTTALGLILGLAAGSLAFASAPARATTQYAFITSDSFTFASEKVLPSPFDCDMVSPPVLEVDPGLPGNADDPPAFTEGGAPVTRTFTNAGTITNSLNPADVVATSATASTTVAYRGSGGTFTGFDISATGQASVTPALGAASGCYGSHRTDADSSAVVTVTQPGWLFIEATSTGTAESAANPGYYYGGLYVQRADPYVDLNEVNYVYRNEFAGLEVSSQKGKRSARLYLAPGQYLVTSFFEVRASTEQANVPPQPQSFSAASNVAGSVSFSGSLVPVGAKDGPTSSAAKGKKYVKLLDRSCASDVVTTQLVKKKLKKASKVVFAVNGKKSKTVKLSKKFPKQGILALGPVADDLDVTVTAVVFLKDKTKARPAVEQSYLSCS